jgi:hypothetical protein
MKKCFVERSDAVDSPNRNRLLIRGRESAAVLLLLAFRQRGRGRA